MKKGQLALVISVVVVSIGATLYLLNKVKKKKEEDKKQALGQSVSDSLKLAPL